MEVLTGTYKAFVDIANAPQLRDAVSNVDKNFNIFITDLYHSVEEVEKTPGPPPQILALKSRNPWIYLKKLHRMFDFTPWILFTILGILTAITGVFLDFGTIYLFNLRLGFATDDNWFIGFLGFYISGFVLASITTAMGAHITPFCDGSGAPEIKSIMSGANTYRYLEPIVFFPKFIGMCTAYGAGMQVGRAGPLVHMSSIIGCWLLKKEPFKHLDKNLAMKRSILSAACGCGTAVALGAPLTGLIFSVEIVIGFVNTSNVFRTFWAICVGLVSVKAMKFFISVDPLHITQFNYYQLDFDLLSFMFLSLICGLLGVAFLKLALKLIYLRRNIVNPIFERYSWVWLTYTLLAVTHFPFKYALQSTRLFYNDAYSIHELSDNPKLQEPILDFTYYAIIKFVTMPFIFSCNIPFGIFGLPLTLGAIVGRLYAEVGQASGLIHPKMKGAYGVVGSAAILATVVRGVFPAAMLIETTGQIEYGIPICVGVLVGYCVGNAFSMSFFDFPIFVRKLPIVASLMTPELYSKNAQQLMDPAYPYIHLDATHKEAFDLITELPEINKALFIPVLDAERHVVGAVKLENLLLYLEQLEEQETARIQGILEHTRKVSMNRHNYDINRWQDIKKFFNKTGTMYEKEEHLEGDSRIVKPSFHMKTFNPKNEDRRVDSEDPVEQFWAKRMDWDSDRIRFDPAPLLVNAQCWSSKIQFLFTSTKTACIMVIDAGKYVGCITSQAFLKQKAY